MLKMDLEYVRKVLFIRLKGNLSRRTTYKINNYLLPLISKHKIKNVIYNFKDLKSIDESGVDAILSTKILVKNNGGKIYLCEVSEQVDVKVKRIHIKKALSEEDALNRLEV